MLQVEGNFESKDDIEVVIYHGACMDGFASAYAIWKYFVDAGSDVDSKLTFIAGKHAGQTTPLPYHVSRLCRDKVVALVDFSYPTAQLIELSKIAKSVLVIDHHISALRRFEASEELRANVSTVFDMNRSGCVLTWCYMFGVDASGKDDALLPRFLRFVEDRDLWRWALRDSAPFMEAFSMVDYAFGEYDAHRDEALVQRAIENGKMLLAYRDSQLGKLNRRSVLVDGFFGFRCRAVNSPVWTSELGNYVLDVEQGDDASDFALVWAWNHSAGSCDCSLRASNDRVDVSRIASALGGGGHKRAAGFRWHGSITALFEHAASRDMSLSASSSSSSSSSPPPAISMVNVVGDFVPPSFSKE
jgi:uncharacterized protein